MCEQAAEAHKSKGAGHSSRRRLSSDSGNVSKSSVDAILSNSSSTPSSQVCPCFVAFINDNFGIILVTIKLQVLLDMSLKYFEPYL